MYKNTTNNARGSSTAEIPLGSCVDNGDLTPDTIYKDAGTRHVRLQSYDRDGLLCHDKAMGPQRYYQPRERARVSQ